jgi:hypothetical protein
MVTAEVTVTRTAGDSEITDCVECGETFVLLCVSFASAA